MEQLETRRVLATLSNMPGDGTLRVDVDGFGSFGEDINDFLGVAGDAFFDPIGPVTPRGTTFESAVAVQFINTGAPVFLSCGMVGTNSPQVDAMTLACPATTPLSPTRITGQFTVPGLNGLFFILTQEVFELRDSTGVRVGSYLKQDYEINNTTSNQLVFNIFRYFDADLRFNGTIAIDGGGRDTTNIGEVLVTTDDATNRIDASSGNLAAILSDGDVRQPVTFFDVGMHPTILENITSGLGVSNNVTRDADNNQIIDNNLGYDVTTALRHEMTLNSNETKTYTTYTFYGDYFLQEQQDGAVIEGMKFEDFNGNGVFEPAQGERGLSGVQVFVDLNDNGQRDTGEPGTTTGANGQYSIDGLTPGMYVVREVVPTNFMQTFPFTGFHNVTIAAADSVVSNVDFGNRSTLATITGMKFADLNGDGVNNGGDYPLSGWRIFADLDGNGVLNAGEPSALTGDDGSYVFRVNAGTLTIREVQQANWQPTTPPGGMMDVTIAPQGVVTVNFGNDPDPATITGVKWSDENANGVRDPGEVGLPDFVIYIDCNGGTLICEDNGVFGAGTEPFVTTGPDGSYSFPDLPPGSYLLREVPMAGWEQTFPSNNQSHSVTLGAGQTVSGVNFGNRAQDGSVSGTKFHDVNRNGVRDPTEPGLPGFFIYADLDEDQQWGLGEPGGITGEFGDYAIPGLRPGTYTFRERPTPGWTQTFPPDGEGHEVTVGPGEVLSGFVFGNARSSDRGDAPAPYPTLALDNGPSHGALTGFGLGPLWDSESDGQPQTGADGDDLNDEDDEDGVRFLTPMAPGETATIEVTVQTGGHTPGFLQAWIDYDGDGDWDDPGERIVTDRLLGRGVHQLNVQVPVSARIGETYARFRYAHAAGLSYTGPATTGEVEDYLVVVLGDEPQANDDQANVVFNSTDNAIPVLDNDYPSYQASSGDLFLFDLTQPVFGTAVIDDGGTETDPSDDVIRYTPPSGFLGTDQFTYTIVDATDQTDTATVTIMVQLPPDPVAIDDTFFVSAGNVGRTLDVLGNDLPGENGPISIATFSNPQHGGLTFGAGSANLIYTPNSGFTGADQFVYTVRDSTGITDTATVTVHVGNDAGEDELAIRLEVVDLNGNAIPGNQIPVGDTFRLRTYVRDLRPVDPSHGVNSPADLGVFSAYLDLLYEALNVSLVPGSVEFGPRYLAGRNQESAIPGIVDELGALQSETAMPLGPGEFLLAEMEFRAERIGETQFKSDPADELPLHESLFYNNIPDAPVTLDQIRFGTTSITVVPAAKLISVQLQVTDMADSPISTIDVDGQFKLRAFVQDVRAALVPHGVFSAYFDVTFNPSFVSFVPSAANPTGLDIRFGDDFRAARNALFDDGLLDEAGAVQGLTASVLGPDPVLLFEVTMRADAMGGVVFRSDPADLPEHEMLLINSTSNIPTAQIEYNSVSLSVAPSVPPFQNQANALDVNDDDDVSPMDALLIINKLNADGSGPLLNLGEGEDEAVHFYYDVNGNNYLEPADVLGVINHLNDVNDVTGLGESDAEGEAAALILDPWKDSRSTSSQIATSDHNGLRESVLPERQSTIDPRDDAFRASSDSDRQPLGDDQGPGDDQDTDDANADDLDAVLAAIAADVHGQWNDGQALSRRSGSR